MTAQRILVLDPNTPILKNLPGRAEHHPSEAISESDVIADTAATISEALSQVKHVGYDTILCRIDGPEEVSFLIRIKKAAPTTPIVALTSGTNPALDDLARDSGADDVQTLQRSPGASRDRVQETPELIARARAALASSKELRRQGRELVVERRRLIARSRILSQEWTAQVKEVFRGFLPLVVEDNSDQVLFLKRAFDKASLPWPLPVMRDGAEAIAYLSGQGEFAERDRHPLPTLIILDLRLPKKSGLEVIQWVRSRPEFIRLPIFILTTSPEHFEAAMALGANDFYTKPMESGGLLEIVRTIAVRWWFFREACEPRERRA